MYTAPGYFLLMAAGNRLADRIPGTIAPRNPDFWAIASSTWILFSSEVIFTKV
jgi:hypothetical protein